MSIIVIYDGQCEFCKQSVAWVEKKLDITALPFQSTDLGPYGLTTEQCAKQVYVIAGGATYAGAGGIAYLLKQRGNTAISWLITASGSLGGAGYRWIASHRSSLLVRIATTILHALNQK